MFYDNQEFINFNKASSIALVLRLSMVFRRQINCRYQLSAEIVYKCNFQTISTLRSYIEFMHNKINKIGLKTSVLFLLL